MNSFYLFDATIETVVDLLKEVLRGTENLTKIFVETIWSDPNINIIIEEILSNTKDLANYTDILEELADINDRLYVLAQNAHPGLPPREANDRTMYDNRRYSEGSYSTDDNPSEEDYRIRDKKKQGKGKGKNKNKNKKNKNKSPHKGHGSSGHQTLVSNRNSWV